ncbi:sigma 54-interacting transcriptional regulator [Polaromonas sp.]|uniref:sigma 54-interacting transcriptional regulator n=1 Tax=Polaromonas sp. TaxID=1869339 RepID=UPI003BA8B852
MRNTASNPPGVTGKNAIEIPDLVVDLRQAKLQELADKLQFTPAEGRIWLADRRMVLLQSETFAALRAELVESLGPHGARGLLTRLGYHAGCRDAELAWKFAGHNASDIDVARTGAVLHALQGFAVSQTVVAGTSSGSDDFYAEWLWKDSIEDDAHIASHGIGGDPACWMEVGYSSGYLSTSMGRRILTREIECRASGQAQCRVVAKPVDRWEDAHEDLQYLEPQAKPSARIFTSSGQMRNEAAEERSVPASSFAGDRIISASTASHVVLHKIDKVAPTNATILLLGESGVGKSMFAREVVRRSQRSGKPFVEVNCAAIPDQLLESELFGAERGAYSGANTSRPGRFEVANGGTIFLDEVATLSLTAQSKLLRVLQNGEIERLGSNTTLRTDVRVMAATNLDLRAAVLDGRFREDLFYRLNVFPIHIQPLRERRDDIALLADLFVQRFAGLHGRRVRRISSRGLQAMLSYAWPGNVRELENVIERAVILAEDDTLLDTQHLFSVDDAFDAASPLRLGNLGHLISAAPLDDLRDNDHSAAMSKWALETIHARKAKLSDVEDALVDAAVGEAKGNITLAAGMLGLTRAQLDYRLKRRTQTLEGSV